ncbi:hypothetical protein HK104_001141 [Borealophlyctis nickersoniae]|nr:hypothetical protein HK104_001141 [Borealophlyctis nickersoniae]
MPLFTATLPKVIVTGASGLLGRAVVRVLKEGGYDVVGTAFSRSKDGLIKLDLTDFDAVDAFVAEQKPQVIIHCAAERRPDVAERDNAAALKLNVTSSERLARAAAQNGAFLIYISTDYVFDGTKPPYEVDDKPNPLQFYGEILGTVACGGGAKKWFWRAAAAYQIVDANSHARIIQNHTTPGRSKYEGELAVLKTNPKAAILRVPILYGDVEYNGESAVNILVDVVLNKDKQVDMDDLQLRYPTNVVDVGKVLKQMADRVAVEGKPLDGIFHFSAKEKFTKYGMCAVIAKSLKTDIPHIHPMREPPKEPVASRPNDAHLSTARLEKEGFDVRCGGFEAWWMARRG